jgi:CcmD family protein
MTTFFRGCGLVVASLLLGTALLAGSHSAFAQPPSGGAAAQEEFVPVKDLPQQEQLPGGPLVLAAYAFLWAALLGYVWTIWRRLRKVEQEMRGLAARVGSSAQRSGVADRGPGVRD